MSTKRKKSFPRKSRVPDKLKNSSLDKCNLKALNILKKSKLFFIFVLGALAYILLNGNTMLENLRRMPAEFVSTKNEFLEWFYNDAQWLGMWSATPQGYVNLDEMNLSKTDLQLAISTMKNGHFDGAIITKNLCPFTGLANKYVLIEGEAENGNRAEATVFDFIGGRTKIFAKLKLKRQGIMMKAIPVKDPMNLFAKSTIIAQDPDIKPSDVYTNFNDVCLEMHESLCKRLSLNCKFLLERKKTHH
jgi:hypothetical protein